MGAIFRRISILIFLSLVFVILSCASVPKEVVELSYVVGEDLEALHHSYRNLIHEYFDALRAHRTEFLESSWIPLFLENYIKEANLVDKIKNSDATMALEWVSIWVEIAMDTITARKQILMEPIDQGEAELTAYVDDAFGRVIWANSVITAHLNSIRNVKELQDEVLTAFGLKGLREKINQGMIAAANKADEALIKFKKADKLLGTVEETRDDFRNALEGGGNE